MIYDLLIIGGGINGTGIARDAAGRGLKTILLEKDDLAAGTSSASTKLLHGGLRYLENYEFRMVHEALCEREIIMRIARHLSRPLRFVLPYRPHLRPRWIIRAGLMLYDLLGFRSPLPRAQSTATGFQYYDGWVDDARLVICNALDAHVHGASIHVREKVTGINAQQDQIWAVTTHAGLVYQARAIINAAGPWVTEVLAASSISQQDMPQLRLVRGSHIIIPRLYDGEHAMLLQQADGRVIFIIPYEGDFTLVGTTEVAQENMQSVVMTQVERDYLLAAIQDEFGCSIDPSMVKATYSGVRPLFDDGKAETRRVTRDYRLLLQHINGAPILSILGGKLTGYRKIAEVAVNRICDVLNHHAAPWTAHKYLPGSEGAIDMPDFLPLHVRQRYARLYGTRAQMIIGDAVTIADMGAEIAPDVYTSEIDYLMQHEWARTANDIIKRRTKLYLHLSADEVAALAAYIQQKGQNHG